MLVLIMPGWSLGTPCTAGNPSHQALLLLVLLTGNTSTNSFNRCMSDNMMHDAWACNRWSRSAVARNYKTNFCTWSINTLILWLTLMTSLVQLLSPVNMTLEVEMCEFNLLSCEAIFNNIRWESLKSYMRTFYFTEVFVEGYI